MVIGPRGRVALVPGRRTPRVVRLGLTIKLEFPGGPSRRTLCYMAETVSERLAAVWARTDRIFEMLVPGAFLARPIALRHPFIFYVGHLPAFAWNHIWRGVLQRPSFDPRFDEIFDRGIDPDVDDPSRCHAHPDVPERWPALDDVIVYRDRVRSAIVESLGDVAAHAPTSLMAEHNRVLSMAIEHELMHQETLLYIRSEERRVGKER